VLNLFARTTHLFFVGPVAIGFALVASGCGGGNVDLRQAARSLVPREARVVAQRPGACVELASFPSCEMLWFSARGQRLGWDASGSDGGDGGTTLHFRKGQIDARVTIWSAVHDYFCKVHRGSARDCADNLQVVRRG